MLYRDEWEKKQEQVCAALSNFKLFRAPFFDTAFLNMQRASRCCQLFALKLSDFENCFCIKLWQVTQIIPQIICSSANQGSSGEYLQQVFSSLFHISYSASLQPSSALDAFQISLIIWSCILP